ncbi:MAG: hemolysin III family protein [Paludibacteraceae bacterium]|nr:hemolysin III family protein [Paludibacteraceae bacterium]
MSHVRTYWNKLPAEEKANTLTHLIPWLTTFGIAWPLLDLAARSSHPTVNIIGTALFLAGMVLMFGSSTLYHFIVAPVHKARLRIFDHISIYVMIAGSYSLLCMSVVGGWLGWSIFVFLWACVIAGVVGKLVALGKHPRLSLVLYLLMGWVALLMIVPLWKNLSHAAFAWILAEGIFYTIGAYFFRLDEERAYYHAIWHVFIILGATSHTIATWLVLSA